VAGPHPAVAEIRHAVRGAVASLDPGDLVLAACSGGPDSLALAAALAFEAPKAACRCGAVTVDHGMQSGSAEVAAKVAAQLAGLGLDPVVNVAVTVHAVGAGGNDGPEAAARQARYAALERAAEQTGAAAILLGHTLDDQAETVLLGLGRGSGARSLAGMAVRSGRYVRPLLGVRRAQTEAACAALGLEPWADPHNDDLRFTRVAVRRQLMPMLEHVLGPGAAEALARTAAMLRADADALDELAAAEAARFTELPAAELAKLPPAIRQRLLRQAALEAGCSPGALSQRHVQTLDELVTGWHGQRWTDLPGGVRCQRRYGRLLFTTSGVPGATSRAGAAPRSEDHSGRE
jgi:tRNA(Ile)-lysidine synthase